MSREESPQRTPEGSTGLRAGWRANARPAARDRPGPLERLPRSARTNSAPRTRATAWHPLPSRPSLEAGDGPRAHALDRERRATIARRFARLTADSPALQALAASGAKLLPHFDGFLLDLYALLYKMNVVFHPPGRGRARPRASTGSCSTSCAARRRSRSCASRRCSTRASPASPTLLLGEALLELLKSERVLTRGEMLDVWNLEQQDEEIDGRADARRDRRVAAPSTGRASRRERQLAELRNRLQRENAAAERRRAMQARRMRQDFADGAARRQPRVAAQVERALQDLEASRDDTEQWSLQLGGGHQSSPGAQIELGHQLARNPKLKRMAQLVGRMRESARALRQQLVRARQRGDVRGRPRRRAQPPAAARAAQPAPSGAAARLLAPLRRRRAARLRAARARGEGARADDRLPRRQLVDGRRQGDLVEGGHADAARHRRAPAPPLPLDLLRLGRDAAADARPQPPPALRARHAPGLRPSPSTFPAAAPTSRSRSARRSTACAAPATRAATSSSSPTANAASTPSGCASSSARRTSSASRSSPCSSTSAPARSARSRTSATTSPRCASSPSDATRRSS